MLEYELKDDNNVDGLAQFMGYKLKKAFQKSLKILVVG